MRTISLKVPQALEVRLTAVADRMGKSKSSVIREAIKAYLANGDTAAPASFAELTADIRGIGAGPGDLSHNEEYLTGYGK